MRLNRLNPLPPAQTHANFWKNPAGSQAHDPRGTPAYIKFLSTLKDGWDGRHPFKHEPHPNMMALLGIRAMETCFTDAAAPSSDSKRRLSRAESREIAMGGMLCQPAGEAGLCDCENPNCSRPKSLADLENIEASTMRRRALVAWCVFFTVFIAVVLTALGLKHGGFDFRRPVAGFGRFLGQGEL